MRNLLPELARHPLCDHHRSEVRRDGDAHGRIVFTRPLNLGLCGFESKGYGGLRLLGAV